ncbi:MAG: cytochrome P450 family protein [Pseudonocardiaceae bacterium]
MSAPRTATSPTGATIGLPITLGGPEFVADPQAHYAWLRENAPVHAGRIASLIEQDVWMVSRYADCKAVLTDDRFRRAPGGESAMTAELPEHMRLLSIESLLYKDDPDHRRLRKLVVKPFTPRTIERLGERVVELAHGLLDDLEQQDTVDLREAFALPIPTTIISEMVGVDEADRGRFRRGMQALLGAEFGEESRNDEAKALVDFVRELIARRRGQPGEDILTGLIQAEEDGDRLADDELVAMVFVLIAAGYETTYNLITNAVVTLLDHPDQLARLRAAPGDEGLWRTAIDEIVRYTGTVGGTEALTAAEDVTWYDQTIPAGAIVIPILGAANRDPAAFEQPEVFDITRHPNNHIGFGHGVHFCLGANLARMETRVALGVLLERSPNLRLALDRAELAFEPVPLLARYRELPVHLG